MTPSTSEFELVLKEVWVTLAFILLPNDPQRTCMSWHSFKSTVTCKKVCQLTKPEAVIIIKS
jgi:hypothetical protein